MKKRIIGTLLAATLLLSLVFTLASCDSYGRFESALENTFTGEHGYDVVAVITGTIEEGGVTDEVNLKYEIKIDKTNSAKTCVKITVNDSPGTVVYYTDGEYVYYEFSGSRLKIKESEFKKNSGWIQEEIRSGLLKPVWGEYEGQINDGTCTEANGTIVWSRSWVEKPAIAERHWLACAPSNVLTCAIFAYSGSYNSTAMYATEFKNASLTATAKDGFITQITAAAALTYQGIKADLSMDLTVNTPDTDVSVSLPADCTSWQELSSNP